MVSVKQLHPVFFGEISGIDVSRPLSPADHKAIVDAIDDCGAVVVDAKNNLWISSRLKGKLRVSAVPTDGP